MGKFTVKVLPSLTFEITLSLPPNNSTERLTIVKPRPEPGIAPICSLFLKNGVNRLCKSSSEMPIPSSLTSILKQSFLMLTSI